MSAMQRNKGHRGEREFLQHLGAELGMELWRNLSQPRDGGADCMQIFGLAIEVKRCEELRINPWWRQTVEQAGGAVPVLAYRQSYHPWQCVVPLSLLSDDFSGQPVGMVATVGISELAMIIRERLMEGDDANKP